MPVYYYYLVDITEYHQGFEFGCVVTAKCKSDEIQTILRHIEKTFRESILHCEARVNKIITKKQFETLKTLGFISYDMDDVNNYIEEDEDED